MTQQIYNNVFLPQSNKEILASGAGRGDLQVKSFQFQSTTEIEVLYEGRKSKLPRISFWIRYKSVQG